ncbi:MAG TPA: hypothetical protein VFT50_00295 [Baekduia sp.]|nr:hypothetical protein [Baekduia sp.]
MLDVLRPGVLDGMRVLLAGGDAVVGARLGALGAEVLPLRAALDDEDAVIAEVGSAGRIDVVVVAGGGPFAAAGGGLAGLRAAVDGGWNAVRAVANACWLQDGAAGGKAVLIAPPPGAGAHAAAAGAALENTARTVSVEWSRFGVRTTAIRPGDAASGHEVAELVAFLASPAGDYATGCAFTLTGAG